MKASSAYYRMAIALIALLLRHSAVSQDIALNYNNDVLKFSADVSVKLKRGGGDYWKNFLLGIGGISVGTGLMAGLIALDVNTESQAGETIFYSFGATLIGGAYVYGFYSLFSPIRQKRNARKKEEEELHHLELVASHEREIQKARSYKETRIAERATGYWILADRDDSATADFPDSCILAITKNPDDSLDLSVKIYSINGTLKYAASNFKADLNKVTFNLPAEPDHGSHVMIEHIYPGGLILTRVGIGDYFFKKFSGKRLQRFIQDRKVVEGGR